MDASTSTTSTSSTTATSSLEGARPTLYVVDALNFVFRAFHALPRLTTSRGENTGAVYGLCQMLMRIEREQRPSHLCAVFDAPGENFRHRIYAGYKTERPPMPPELAPQLERVHEVVGAFGIQTLSVPGFEADDVIATVARLAVAEKMDVVICSSDKDLTQLCGPGITILDTMKNRFLTAVDIRERFGVGPEQVGDVLALTGDSIDNVPGVDGIGPKTAAELVNRYGSLAEVLAHADEVKGKRGEALRAARAQVVVSRELVRLREDVPLSKTLAELHRHEPDNQRLLGLFRALEFSRLADNLAAASASASGGGATMSAAVGLATGAAVAGVPASSPAPAVGPAGAGEGGEPGAEGPGETEAGAPPGGAAAAVTVTPMVFATPVDAEILSTPSELAALASALAGSGDALGFAIVWDGPSPVQAELVGLAFATGAGRRVYVPLSHRYLGAPPSLRATEALAIVGPLLARPDLGKAVHDAKTTAVVLQGHGVRLGGVVGDAMLAGYLLDASRTRYDLEVIAAAQGITDVSPRAAWLGTGKTLRAAADVLVDEAGRRLGAEAAAALGLAGTQRASLELRALAPLYRDLELPLAAVLARIECRGISLDTDYLRALGQEVGQLATGLEAEIHALAGLTFNISSNKQLADVLFGKLALPVIRKTKTGASTDADTLEELAALHPVPAKIVEYRGLMKLKGTYIDALPALVNPRTGRLHTSFNQAVAATGRLSSSDPNLQNIPIRTELGRRIRQAFLARPGYALVSADYSQIELRVLAHFSGDPRFVEAFRAGEDIHQRTAAEVFEVPPSAVTLEHRRVAKAINFGLVFGQTDFGLAQTLRIPRPRARAYIDNYFRRYGGVRDYMERAIAQARVTGEVTTLLGRRRPLPEIRSTRVQERNYAERIARNTPIQGSAADLLKLAMIRVERGIEAAIPAAAGAELLLTVHDELVFEVPTDRVSAFSAWVKAEMEQVMTLEVPLVVDVGSGTTWGDAHH
jgi:DNA polymerase I